MVRLWLTLIRDIACASPVGCSVQVKTQLVMPELLQKGAATFAPGGGNAGRLSDVSRGLWQEVYQFRKEVNDAAAALADPKAPSSNPAIELPTRLVFNESFGWSDDGSADTCGDDPAQSKWWNVRAVCDAFQAAGLRRRDARRRRGKPHRRHDAEQRSPLPRALARQGRAFAEGLPKLSLERSFSTSSRSTSLLLNGLSPGASLKYGETYKIVVDQ